MCMEWTNRGKPSALGIATGAIAGLAAITPASGTVGPIGALAIGATSAVCCYIAAGRIKRSFGYDDSLDVFGVHGVGGFVGVILTGVFTAEMFSGVGLEGSIGTQIRLQLIGAGVTIVYSGVLTLVIVKVLDGVMGLRVTPEEETGGLDLALHNESGYNL